MDAECVRCGEEYSIKRKALGYDTCLKCGDTVAQVQIAAKQKRIMPAGNKMGYTLMSLDLKTALSEAKGLARKTENQ